MLRRFCFAFVVCLVVCGCGATSRKSDVGNAKDNVQPEPGTGKKGTKTKTTSTDDTSVPRKFRMNLTVSKDAAALSAARQLVVQKRARFIAGLMEKLGTIHYFEKPTLDDARAAAKSLVPALKKMLTAKTVEVRLEAAVLLARLNEPAGLQTLFELLQDSQQRSEIVGRALRQLVELPASLVLEGEGHKSLLLKQLAHKSAAVQVDAVEVCGRLKVPGAAAHFARMLQNEKLAARPGRTAHWLAQVEATEATLKRIDSWLLNGKFTGRRFWLADAAMNVGRYSPTPAVKAQAVDLIHRYIMQVEKGKLPIEETQIKTVAEFLGRYGSERQLPILKRMFTQLSVPEDARGPALLAWVRVSVRTGAAANKLIAGALQGLDDVQLRSSSALALAELLGDKEPPGDVIEKLREAAAKSEEPADRVAIADALMRMKGDAAKAASGKLTKQLGPADQMRIHWINKGIKLEDAVKELIKYQILPDRNYDRTIAEVRKALKLNGNEANGFYEVVKRAGSMAMFFRVVDEHPCGHDRLIAQFASVSRGAFRPEAIHEHLDEEGEADEYRLQFIADQRLYQFRAQVLEELFDVSSVVTAINRACADSGRAERFVSVSTDEQVGTFLFGDPARIRKAAEVLHFPMQDKVSSSLKSTKLLDQAIKNQSK